MNPTSSLTRLVHLLLGVLLLTLGLAGGTAPALALPRYAASYGQSCTLCHENPTGGGLRNLYATQYLIPEEIAARSWPSEDEAGFLAGQSPEISPNITIGADLRTLSYQQDGGVGSTFAMQGDLYVNLQLSATASAYVEQGLTSSGEIFGLLRDLPLEGHFKAGRFIPDHGWRFADHQMFNRRYLLDSQGSESPAFLYDSGFELGASPGPVEFSVSVLSGRESHGDNYAGRILLRQEAAGVRVGVGGSVFRRNDPAGHRRAVAGIWYLSTGPLTWLGEIDETSRPDGPADAPRLGNLVAQEVTVRWAPGWESRLTYGFQDPNRAEKTGARHRYGAGAAYMPRPFFALQLMGNYWDVEQGVDVSGDSYYEGELMVHFFY
jgi:hypothetical protein